MLTSHWAISLQMTPSVYRMSSTLVTCSDTTMFCGHHPLINLILEVPSLPTCNIVHAVMIKVYTCMKEKGRGEVGQWERMCEKEGGERERERCSSDSLQVERMTTIGSSLTQKRGGAWRLIIQGLTLLVVLNSHWMDWLWTLSYSPPTSTTTRERLVPVLALTGHHRYHNVFSCEMHVVYSV